MMLSSCGVNCRECAIFEISCAGCREISGKVYWAEYIDSDTCPLYDCCVRQKGLEHCGRCEELPCQLFFDTQDPSASDKEHREGIKQRVRLLQEAT